MKTLIEKFTETVRLTATIFVLQMDLTEMVLIVFLLHSINGDWQDIFTANHVV